MAPPRAVFAYLGFLTLGSLGSEAALSGWSDQYDNPLWKSGILVGGVEQKKVERERLHPSSMLALGSGPGEVEVREKGIISGNVRTRFVGAYWYMVDPYPPGLRRAHNGNTRSTRDQQGRTGDTTDTP